MEWCEGMVRVNGVREFCSFLPGEAAALVTQPFSIPVPGSLWLWENPGAGLMSPPALASLSFPRAAQSSQL